VNLATAFRQILVDFGIEDKVRIGAMDLDRSTDDDRKVFINYLR
jgi:hypothetical protein